MGADPLSVVGEDSVEGWRVECEIGPALDAGEVGRGEQACLDVGAYDEAASAEDAQQEAGLTAGFTAGFTAGLSLGAELILPSLPCGVLGELVDVDHRGAPQLLHHRRVQHGHDAFPRRPSQSLVLHRVAASERASRQVDGA
ncbi:MAG: hypothetical protein Q7V43_27870, partial [Myxococcales bacterium]|nr:hypothetical protein [Myxococcales bacterium]